MTERTKSSHPSPSAKEPIVFIVEDDASIRRALSNLFQSVGLDVELPMAPIRDRPRELVIRSDGDEKQGVVLSVKDCGVGISDNNSDELFKAFFTTKSGGMGMGLSICRSIVAAHGGQLFVSPGDLHGSVFHLELPIYQPGVG